MVLIHQSAAPFEININGDDSTNATRPNLLSSTKYWSEWRTWTEKKCIIYKL